MIVSDYKIALHTWAEGVSGITCYWVQDNGPKPDNPAISLQIINTRPKNHVHRGEPDPSGQRSYLREHNLWLKLDAFGDNAMGNLSQFTIANELSLYADPLRTAVGLSMVDNTEILDITGLNDSLNEERATMNIRFTFGDRFDGIDDGLIENVEGVGTLRYPDGTDRIQNFTINTP